MRVLFATAELSPTVKVGGLGDFSAGYTKAVRSHGIEIDIVLPDYGGLEFETQSTHELEVADWSAPATVRVGLLAGDRVSLVSVPEMTRPDPYVDADGRPWPDNDRRFLGFSAATAAWATLTQPDVLHLNDWHTASIPGFLAQPPPSVLTIHNLAYQGDTDAKWLEVLQHRRDSYDVAGKANPLAGGIAVADRVVAVSPRFVEETLPPNHGFGLGRVLSRRGSAYLGILNGIDTEVWDPASDSHLSTNFDDSSPGVKSSLRAELAKELGWEEPRAPLVGMVTRLTDQKGVDIALEVLPTLDELGAAMVMLGSGERSLARAATEAERRFPGSFRFREGYDEGLSHRIFGASDLYLMPSRFEPAGLAQMQAMRYGALPVVTDVGGLHDTVVDDDAHPGEGIGFVATSTTASDVADALSRAVKAWRSPERRAQIIERGMTADWSWREPARAYVDLYHEITSAR